MRLKPLPTAAILKVRLTDYSVLLCIDGGPEHEPS